MAAPSTSRSGRFHLALMPEVLINRPPLVDFRILKFAKGLQLLLPGWEDILPDIGESLAYRRVSQDGHDRVVEFFDNIFRAEDQLRDLLFQPSVHIAHHGSIHHNVSALAQ
jgi:hypothetical protein